MYTIYTHTYNYTHTYTHTHTHVYIYIGKHAASGLKSFVAFIANEKEAIAKSKDVGTQDTDALGNALPRDPSVEVDVDTFKHEVCCSLLLLCVVAVSCCSMLLLVAVCCYLSIRIYTRSVLLQHVATCVYDYTRVVLQCGAAVSCSSVLLQ